MKTKETGNLRLLVYVALVLSMLGNVIAISALLHVENLNSELNLSSGQLTYSVTGPLYIPPTSLADAPVITTSEPFGSRLTDINSAFSSEELAIIDRATNNYFEVAGEMLLNGTLKNIVSPSVTASYSLKVDGKYSVIYLGAISCIFCGENRWAMALALSRFGNFSQLFKGYSSLGDGDVPTIYWRPDEYAANSSVDIGNFYNSSLINFLSIEYASPITANFQMQTVTYISQYLEGAGSQAYYTAMEAITANNNFAGTPYTIWGKFSVSGADATVLGNATGSLSIENMTHDQVLNQLASPRDQFAWSDYAAADIYVALTCASLKSSLSVCALPAIVKIQSDGGY